MKRVADASMARLPGGSLRGISTRLVPKRVSYYPKYHLPWSLISVRVDSIDIRFVSERQSQESGGAAGGFHG